MVYPGREIGQLRSLQRVDLILGPNGGGYTTRSAAASFTEDETLCIAMMEAAGQESTCICDKWPESAERCRASLAVEVPLEEIIWYAVFPAGGIWVFGRPEVRHYYGRWGLTPEEAALRWPMVTDRRLRLFILGLFPRVFYGSTPPTEWN